MLSLRSGRAGTAVGIGFAEPRGGHAGGAPGEALEREQDHQHAAADQIGAKSKAPEMPSDGSLLPGRLDRELDPVPGHAEGEQQHHRVGDREEDLSTSRE
jgi:hypothetical protein